MFSGSKNSISLIQSEGYDIQVADFTHSSCSSSINIIGSEGEEVTLVDWSDGKDGIDPDSTTVGGEIVFSSMENFSVASSVSSTSGSIFKTSAGISNASALFSISDIDITSVKGAGQAILIADGAIYQIDTIRGDLGAIQNRFESTMSNLQNISENLVAARSRIMDADIAAESSNLTKQNILQQAGVSILSQANQQPQLALSLLGNL